MKTQVRNFWTIAILGGALAVSGCTNTQTTRSRAVGFHAIGPAPTLTVIESSSDRKFTGKDLDALRDAVTKYLASEGLARSGEYYVRVDFPPDKPGQPAEWVVVKVTTPASSNNYTLVAAFPAIGPDDYYPSGFAYDEGYGAYGYWNPADAYFDSGYFYPATYHPVPYPGNLHRRDGRRPDDHRGGDNDNDHDGRRDGNDKWRDRNGNPDVSHRHPDNTHDRTPTDHKTDGRGHWNHPPRDPGAGRSHDRNPGDSFPSRPESSGGSYSSPSAGSGGTSTSMPSDPGPSRESRNDSGSDRVQPAR